MQNSAVDSMSESVLVVSSNGRHSAASDISKVILRDHDPPDAVADHAKFVSAPQIDENDTSTSLSLSHVVDFDEWDDADTSDDEQD